MRVEAFDYELPPERIAQRPLERRDASRLMVLRGDEPPLDSTFAELPRWLARGDLLVLNDTRVGPWRLVARKPSGGRVELLLVEREGASDVFAALLRASRKPAPGTRLELEGGLAAELLARSGELWRVRLETAGDGLEAALERAGRVPLPPYIERRDGVPAPVDDRERYQTVYAARDGASAAPTAGLHVTPRVLARLRASGVELGWLTLHVGPGTFLPVRSERIEDHRLHGEWLDLPPALAAAVDAARARGGRVVALGTTVVRALEGRIGEDGRLRAGQGTTTLFIRPGHRFRAVDALVTNFHLPRSTLLMLVSAFAGRERVLDAYRTAIERGYRFYSYGDAMLVLGR